MARSEPQLNFRCPPELRERLERSAAYSKRSLTAELIARLEASYQEPGETPRERLLAETLKEANATIGYLKSRVQDMPLTAATAGTVADAEAVARVVAVRNARDQLRQLEHQRTTMEKHLSIVMKDSVEQLRLANEALTAENVAAHDMAMDEVRKLDMRVAILDNELAQIEMRINAVLEVLQPAADREMVDSEHVAPRKRITIAPPGKRKQFQSTINKVIIVGNLGRDPAVQVTTAPPAPRQHGPQPSPNARKRAPKG